MHAPRDNCHVIGREHSWVRCSVLFALGLVEPTLLSDAWNELRAVWHVVRHTAGLVGHARYVARHVVRHV